MLCQIEDQELKYRIVKELEEGVQPDEIKGGFLAKCIQKRDLGQLLELIRSNMVGFGEVVGGMQELGELDSILLLVETLSARAVQVLLQIFL